MLLKLQRPAQALAGLAAVIEREPHHGEAWCLRGHALSDLGRDDEAVAAYAAVGAADPHHAAAAFHRALALNRLRRHGEALAALEPLVRGPAPPAEACWRHGQTLQELQRDDEAIASYRRALERDPNLAQCWSQLGALLKDRGELAEAAQCLRRAIDGGADAALNGYLLAACDGAAEAPPQSPAAYVRGLFDGYAERFDEHLVQVLRYRAHELIARRVATLAAAVPGGRFGPALDLGCGTGLCAPLLAPHVAAIDGVDLSAAMLGKARARNVYRRLDEADVADHLATTAERYALLVAADVFIYVGALEAVFAGARRVLRRGGVFCFSAERSADEAGDFRLLASGRYAQSASYLRRLAGAHGLEVLQIDEQPIREDQQRPVAGLIVTLRRAGG